MKAYVKTIQCHLFRLLLEQGFRVQPYTWDRIDRYQYTEYSKARLDGEQIVLETEIMKGVFSVLRIEKDGSSHWDFRVVHTSPDR